uniref:Uncharacterized protein n=1 Tax=Cucumis melo TaxID=3656 RepID=A0A9I9D446_CUCME
MWRRLLSSSLKSLKSLPSSSTPASAPLGCISQAARLGAASHLSPSSTVSLFARHYASDSADTGLKKKVEDVMPIATGHEREELEASLEVKYLLEVVGPGGSPDGYGDDDHHH